MFIRDENVFFHELDTRDIVDAIVILDIDGTLTCSSKKQIKKEVIKVVRELEKRNEVYIFSNNYDCKKSREIAESINIPYIEAPHKKPNKKILKYINETCPVITIGDKYLTDGLFAKFAKARHIRVKRYRCNDDSIMDRFACFVDDVAYAIAKLFHIVTS